ncbi:hypothetical protein E2562_024348 [Oryza meyeriana var. granulata]|uniref:FAF domain-containing protein n=1 Tax=Oryza meyeriana var. granulata TaxID=110450 RepID=A0A6G1C8H6_9ORYZ|nr:hypothetical protein E2562_024348 [Oryza meyeriana var. granulata]
MAADGGGALKRLFEKPLPENPTLLEELSSWNHTHRKKLVDPASFTEIFGELHFQEKPDQVAIRSARPSPSPPPPPPPRRTVSWLDVTDAAAADKSKDDSSLDALLKAPKPASGGGATVKRSASFCLKSSRSLLLCTEGLGSESTVDADDMVKDGDNANVVEASVANNVNEMDVDTSYAVVDAAEGKEKRPPSFPPPIRSIGRGGKPCVCFRSVRAEGRFVLLEVVIPGKDLLQATREGGRLRLRFANAAAAVGVGVGVVDEEMHAREAASCIGGDTFA